jgi:AcrR family transcriptional regulator
LARPKSEDKRKAILSAAGQVFAERGLGAPTSVISAQAGIAEGTLFTYFRTKDDLLNALYRELKAELADAMLSGFPPRKSFRHRLQHVWNGYVDWGVANPVQHRALLQIEVWAGLTEESRAAGAAPFAEIQSMAEAAREQRVLRDLPHDFVAAIISSLAEATMRQMLNHPKRARTYRDSGFEVLWEGITHKT